MAYGYRCIDPFQDLRKPVKVVIKRPKEQEAAILSGFENCGHSELTFVEKVNFPRILATAEREPVEHRLADRRSLDLIGKGLTQVGLGQNPVVFVGGRDHVAAVHKVRLGRTIPRTAA